MTAPQPTQAIQKDTLGNPIYSGRDIALYEATLAHEERRLSAGTQTASQRAFRAAMAGGTGGKSALLNRITSGLAPLVLPPPKSYGYPCYTYIEDEGPWEVLMDEQTIGALIALGERCLGGTSGVPRVILDQSLWRVVAVTDDTSADLSMDGWEELGFRWRLSLDIVPARETERRILSWHDPSLGKVTTLSQLEAEQLWHVRARVAKMRAAHDPAQAEAFMAAALARDQAANAKHGNTAWVSRYESNVATQQLVTMGNLIAERVSAGKPPVPDEAEVQSMARDAVASYFIPKDKSGFGWYSVAEDGQTLLLHAWRLHRIAPAQMTASIYLDLSETA